MVGQSDSNRFFPAAIPPRPPLFFCNSAALWVFFSFFQIAACLINCCSLFCCCFHTCNTTKTHARLSPLQESNKTELSSNKWAAWCGVATLCGWSYPEEPQDFQQGWDWGTSKAHLDANIADRIVFVVPFT